MSGREQAAGYAYSGPCVHCGHLPDEHGEDYACWRWGCAGLQYTPAVSTSPADSP